MIYSLDDYFHASGSCSEAATTALMAVSKELAAIKVRAAHNCYMTDTLHHITCCTQKKSGDPIQEPTRGS
jgi:hypothetical protein